jgi:hypothetical protein
MSMIDSHQEFNSSVDDWWARLWALQVGAQPPEGYNKRFLAFCKNECDEAGSWKIDDDVLGQMFSQFVGHLGDW